MLDILELTYGRYNGGTTVPAGSYLNPRTLCVFQTAVDAALPQDGTFVRIDPSGTQTFANIAITMNTILPGSSYSAASFHACAGGDNVQSPGTATNDA